MGMTSSSQVKPPTNKAKATAEAEAAAAPRTAGEHRQQPVAGGGAQRRKRGGAGGGQGAGAEQHHDRSHHEFVGHGVQKGAKGRRGVLRSKNTNKTVTKQATAGRWST